MDDTQTPSAGTDPLTFPTGNEVYDSLMGSIEPELLSANIPHLDDPYIGESEADHAARYERYTAAFVKYDEAYANWEAQLNSTVTTYRRTALQTAEAESRAEDASALSMLEENLEQATPPAAV